MSKNIQNVSKRLDDTKSIMYIICIRYKMYRKEVIKSEIIF
ncbi:hypothetical protein LPLmcIH18_0034 [Listeria phage LP-LmcIH1-8]|nr:hypothetical protein LPLmcIH18_0034 [Listeria phage LP-LmcIH1-8]